MVEGEFMFMRGVHAVRLSFNVTDVSCGTLSGEFIFIHILHHFKVNIKTL